jgi:hypothetical protein
MSNIWKKIRRNHGLEHATLQLLSQRLPSLALIGLSDWSGFRLFGQVETPLVIQAANEALARLRLGEAHLALHPRCGTMLVVTGLVSGSAAYFAASSSGSRQHRPLSETFPNAILAACLGAIIAQPLGFLIQEKITTSGNPGSLKIIGVERYQEGEMLVHRVQTAQEA